MAMVFTGCNSQATSDKTPDKGEAHEEEYEGPHGGHLIELGREHEYHAELVEDEKAKMITVYMLDKKLKEMAIDQPLVVMNLMVDGHAKTLELAAANAIDGKASRFESSDPALFEALFKHEATGKFRATINGVPYSGDIKHDHDHDDHDDHGHGKAHAHGG
jgi:hypothetical protein